MLFVKPYTYTSGKVLCQKYYKQITFDKYILIVQFVLVFRDPEVENYVKSIQYNIYYILFTLQVIGHTKKFVKHRYGYNANML